MTQETMYPTIVGDKFTALTAAYVAGTDTTITVEDASFLPSAPNLATIRKTDRSALVTVIYTGKTATTLTGVAVLEGDSTAALTAIYAIGSIVSRPLTKADMDAIQGNITDHVGNTLNPHAVTKAQVGLPNVPDGAQINVLEGVQLAGTDATILNKKVNIPEATTSARGLESAADKAKLNGIATGAQVNVLEGVQVAGIDLTIANKKVSINNVPKLTTARKIDGVSFDGSADVNRFGTCSTAAATTAKTVSITGFSLTTGAIVVVKFANGNVANSPTLNITSTGAKAITHLGVAISPEKLAVGGIYALIYDGTNYEFVGSLIEDNPNITIHGFIVDETNSDPQNCMTYVGASKALADYAARFAAYQTLCRHCVVKAAERQFYVDETNWAKKEDGTTDSGLTGGTSLDGDFVMEYPSFWWRITPLGTDVHMVEFTWDNPGSSGDWIPCHMRNGTIRKAHWVGAFEGIVVDGKLRSVYSTTTVPTVSMTNEAFHTAAKANGTAGGLTGDDNTYTISQPLVYIMRCILKYWLYKTLDLQTDVARGIVDDGSSVIGKRAVGYGMSLTGGYTQGTPASSQVYTDNVAAVYGGEVNSHGNVWEHMIDFAYRFGEIAFAIDGADHFDITTLTTVNWDASIPEKWEKVKGVGTTSGYIRKMLWAAHFPFISKDTSGGSSTTYWADYTYRNSGDNANNKVPRCCLAGAYWGTGSSAGPAYLALNSAVGASSGSVGARLQITSKD